MSRTIEAIMAHLVRAAEQPVAPTYKIKLTGILVVLALPQAALAGDKADLGDEKALQERNETFVAAFNRGDIKAMAASYAPDCDFLSAEGQRVKGRDALEKYFAKGFAESKGLKLKHTHSYRRFLTPDVAIDDGAWEITGRPEGKPSKGLYTAILMKRDGQWLVVYDRPMVPVQPPKPELDEGSHMQILRDVLKQAEENRVAIGHFNVADLVLLKAVFAAAQELKVPVIIGVSEGEREFIGVRQIAVLVRSLREEFDFPIFLNADHTHSLGKAIDAAKAGFDSIVFDLSALPFDENVRQTKEGVETLKKIKSAILIEGEIGDIGTGSEIHEKALDVSKGLTTADEAKRFVEATGVDILAPAVGNMHGMLKSMVKGETRKHLDIDRIAQIKGATRIPLTLHGGSGTDDEDLRKAIAAGINIVHINTELRVAWRRGLEEGLASNPTEVVPYKILPFAVQSAKQVVLSRLKLFNKR